MKKQRGILPTYLFTYLPTYLLTLFLSFIIAGNLFSCEVNCGPSHPSSTWSNSTTWTKVFDEVDGYSGTFGTTYNTAYYEDDEQQFRDLYLSDFYFKYEEGAPCPTTEEMVLYAQKTILSRVYDEFGNPLNFNGYGYYNISLYYPSCWWVEEWGVPPVMTHYRCCDVPKCCKITYQVHYYDTCGGEKRISIKLLSNNSDMAECPYPYDVCTNICGYVIDYGSFVRTFFAKRPEYEIDMKSLRINEMQNYSFSYPEPANEYINIQYSSADKGQIVLYINNVLGENINRINISKSEKSIEYKFDVRNLPSGKYFFYFTQGNYQINRGSFSIIH
ncbi:MAG: Secretion system C-terminal sorting domain [Bacteroidota bacterium]|nr:Secretion system C-terminal sorting domain [Bacteroidota bacterium]